MRSLRHAILSFSLAASFVAAASCRSSTQPPGPDPTRSVEPTASEGALAKLPPAPPTGSASSLPPPTPPPDDPAEIVRFMAGPPRAMVVRARDVLIVDAATRAVTTLGGGDEEVLGAGESIDGALVGVIAGGKLRVYRAAGGGEVRSFDCASASFRDDELARPVAFDGAGKRVAALCKKVHIFDLSTGETVAEIAAHDVDPKMLAFHGDSGALVVSGPLELAAHDVASGKRLHQATIAQSPGRAVLAADGRHAVAYPGLIEELPAPTKTQMVDTMAPGKARVIDDLKRANSGAWAEFSPDGARVVVKGEGWARLFDAATAREIGSFRTGETSHMPSLSADGRRVLVYTEARAWVGDAPGGRLVARLEGRSYAPGVLSPDGAFALEPGRPGFVLRSVEDGKVLLRQGERPLPRPAEPAVRDEAEPDKGFTAAMFLPRSGRLLAWGAAVARLYDVHDGTHIDVGNEVGGLKGASVSQGHLVLVGSEGVEVRDALGALKGRIKARVEGEGRGAALSPGAGRIALVGESLRVFEVATGAQVMGAVLPIWQPIDAAFTPDPDLVVVAGPASFVLVELSTSRLVGLEHGTGTGGTFPTVVSPDGRWVGAGAGAGHVASLWSTLPYRYVGAIATADGCTNHTWVSFGDDGARASAWSNGSFVEVEPATLKVVSRRRVGNGDLRWASSDDAGKVALFANDRGVTEVVDRMTGRKIAGLEGEVKGELALSGDGAVVAEAAGGEVVLRSAKSGKVTRRLPR